MTEARTVASLIAVALAAYERLSEVAEEIEDEWTYVTDLAAAWRAELDSVGAGRGGEPIEPATATAIERVAEEADRITDPHRAIDWLSTFPQVVLLALGASA